MEVPIIIQADLLTDALATAFNMVNNTAFISEEDFEKAHKNPNRNVAVNELAIQLLKDAIGE